ncbi:M23 family metallopeptidase [Nibrella saemangeumensis]|uniref:M23 family metallopeptidase n=1 Tax=Nibrella saemangeumensis TaxID=1084526 RepID=UPI0031EF4DF7
MCQDFQALYTHIREQSISPDSARTRFSAIMRALRSRFPSVESLQSDSSVVNSDSLHKPVSPFVFPLRGHSASSIGGSRGEGYRARGFDLFDFNVQGSHPAQDIFVRDRDQDSIEDRTGQPVDVLAMTSGLVIGIETAWLPGSEYRGGNWIWLYDPLQHGLFYYAHNNAVEVLPGQWVKAGQKIAEVGRTGYNAFKTRSPTHLHLMYLRILPNGLPEPRNTYDWLVVAQVMP